MAKAEFVGPALYPVIHNEHVQQTLRDVEVVLNAGADGVFLINHELNASSLLTRYRAVVNEFPSAFVGLNFLDMRNPLDVFILLSRAGVTPDAIWTDWFPSEDKKIAALSKHFRELKENEGANLRETELFAGVAHKAASYVDDPFLCAEMARTVDGHVDYITTTGPGTGLQTPIEKLVAMRGVTLMSKLAVASGVTPDNVTDYVPHVDAILVASSLESRFGEIDPERLRTFMSAFRYSIIQERERREVLESEIGQVEPEPIDYYERKKIS
jgi:hypothetical protein